MLRQDRDAVVGSSSSSSMYSIKTRRRIYVHI